MKSESRPGHSTMRLVLLAVATAPVISAALAVWTFAINDRWLTTRDLVLLAGHFFIFLMPGIALLTVAAHLWSRRVGSPPLRTAVGLYVAALFLLTWAVRFEPAHQFLSIDPHLGLIGASFLIAAILAAITIIGIAVKTAHLSGLRWAAAMVLVVIVINATFVLIVTAFEPDRERTEAIERLGLLHAGSATVASGVQPAGRLLFIGIDGLDPNIAADLTESNHLPNLRKLLESGRACGLDNENYKFSAEIWTTAYTGAPSPSNGVGAYERWSFAGLSHEIVRLPRFGFHSLWMLERVLPAAGPDWLWSSRPITSRDLERPPLWTIATRAGRHVAVFDPLPFPEAPERVDGTFVVPRMSEWEAFSSRFGRTRWTNEPDDDRNEFEKLTPLDHSKELRRERRQSRLAAEMFASQRYDLGIYYTHALDMLKHRLGPSVSAEPLSPRLAEAYQELDRTVGMLTKAFGDDATVFLMSDHGWDFGDFEHYLSPDGLVIISPAPPTSEAGRCSIQGVLPSLLALLSLPSDRMMAEPFPGIEEVQTRVASYADLEPDYWTTHENQEFTIQQLRSLGYLR
ncbi:MAG: alkaline phosphatase family protein [Acidobacteria bacterium]|nr:alkaline phosphatase family protein [Acidobacteriota bacterium]